MFSSVISIVGTIKAFAGEFGRAVRVGGATIHDGDLVVGDAEAVVAIRANAIETTMDAADARVDTEQKIFVRLEAGETTLDVYGLPQGTLR